MHPFIRILCMLVIAVLTPWLPGAVLFAAGLLLLVRGVAKPEAAQAMVRSVKRIRWLLLSLLVLYLWFSPGAPVLPPLGPLSPTDTGLILAAERAGVLLVLVFAAAAFLADMPPRELTAALRRLLAWPVATAPAMRFADRVGLLFAELPVVELRVRAVVTHDGTAFASRAASLFRSVEADATADIEPEPLPDLPPVPRTQWLLPSTLLIAGLLVVLVFPGS